MRFEGTGKVTEDFYVTGSPVVPVYLLDGPVPVLFDSGITALAYLYEKDIKKILGGRKPAYLFITHSHFDHIGAAFFFKETWPDLLIAGSARCQEILKRPGAVELINNLNVQARKEMKESGVTPIYQSPFQVFDIDMIIDPDSEIKINPSITVNAISTPGHTWDFMSYWIPEKKILIGSEALGCYEGKGYVQTDFLIDYDKYLDSLKKLTDLEVEIVCVGHHAVFSGPDAREHMNASLKAAPDYLTMAEKILTEERGDVDRTIERIKAIEWDQRPWPKQPEQAYLISSRQKVMIIRERMKKSRGQ